MPTARRRVRSIRVLAALFGLSLLSCGREVTGPGDGIDLGWNRNGALAIAPEIPGLPSGNLASDVEPFERVRVVLRRGDGSVVKDTMVSFPSTADSVTLAITIPLPLTAPDTGISLGLTMAFINAAGDTVFRGGPTAVTVRPSASSGANDPVSIPVAWVPPAIPPASVTLTPTGGTVVAGTSTNFSATVRDAQNNVMTGIPVEFYTPDTARATVNVTSGAATWKPSRGAARVIARLLNGPADTAGYTVSLPASQVVAVSGNAQTALAGTALAQPLVMRVAASDGIGVAGVTVNYTVTTGGGSLNVNTDVTDANGLVAVNWTLGATVGAQSVTATAAGVATPLVLTATGTAPVTTQLVITNVPTTLVAGATITPLTVEARDAGNVLTPLFNGPVTVALAANGAGAVLLGTTTVNAVNGVATFNATNIQRAATGLNIVATSGALTQATSAAITVNPAAPANIARSFGDAQSGTVGQSLTDSLEVTVTDAFANPVPGATVTWSVLGGGGSVAPAGTLTGATGRARARWTLGNVVGAQSVQATAGALNTTFTATGQPGVAVALEVTVNPAALQTAGVAMTPAITVRAVDGTGATATSFTGLVSLAFANNPTGTSLQGTPNAVAVAGIATFNDVSVNAAGAGYTIAATSGPLTPDTTTAFTIQPGVASQMSLVSGNGQSGPINGTLAQPFVARVTDDFSNPLAGITVNWAVTTGAGTLTAPTSVTNAAGDAANGITLPGTPQSIVVQASVAGLTGSPVSFSATTTFGAASQLVFTQVTTTGVAGVAMAGPGFTVQARDAGGNVVPTFTGPVTIALTGGAGTLGGTTTVNAVAGVANFFDLTIDHVGTTWTLTATSGALTAAVVNNIIITAAAPANIVVQSGNNQTAGALTQLPVDPVFHVSDAFGNPAPGVGVTFAVTLGGGSVGSPNGITDAAGNVSTTWTLGGTLGSQTLDATVNGFPAVTTNASATATSGTATQLVVTSANIPQQVAGAFLPTVTVEARDGANNLVTSFTGAVTGRIDVGPNAGDSVVVNAVGGVASFVNAAFDSVGTYVLRFTAPGLTDVLSNSFVVVPNVAYFLSPAVPSGDNQSRPVLNALLQPLRTIVTDSLGNAIANHQVIFTMARGVDTLRVDTIPTDAAGIAALVPVMPATVGPVQFIVTSAGLVGSGFVLNATAIPGTAFRLVVTTQPTNTVSQTAIPAMTVEARDAQDNLVTGFTGAVNVVVDSGPQAGWSMGGNQTRGAVAGVATFDDITLDRAGQYKLRFTSGALDSAITTEFLITPGTPAGIVIASGNNQSGGAGTALTDSITARVVDAVGNGVATMPVTWSIQGGGGSLSPAAGTTDANGLISTQWTLGAPGAQVARATFGAFFVDFSANSNATTANVTWTGAVNDDWHVAGNWSGGTVPVVSDSVRIADTPNQPHLTAPAFISRLQMDANTSLQLDTFPLFVNGTVDIDQSSTMGEDGGAGALVLTGTGNVRGNFARLFLQGGSYTLNGALLVATDLVISGGGLDIGTGTATVLGLFSTTGTGVLRMSGAGSLTVEGNAVFGGGGEAGSLSNGTIHFHGDFVQAGGSQAAYSATAGHTTVFNGPATQHVTLLNPDASFSTTCGPFSCFGRFLSNRSAGTGDLILNSPIKALGDVEVSGDGLDATGMAIIGGAAMTLTSTTVTARIVGWHDSIVRTGGTFAVDTLVAWGNTALIVGEVIPTVVLGNATISGAHPAPVSIEQNGTLAVVNSAEIGTASGLVLRTRGNGRLLMQDALDSLVVNGDAEFGGVTVPGLMNDGLLTITGNLSQTDDGNSTLFFEGAHRTRFIGTNPTLHFTRITGNQLMHADIDAFSAFTIDGNAHFGGDVRLGPAVSVVGGGVIELDGDLIDTLANRWQVTETLLNKADPVVPLAMIGSVVFVNGAVLDTTLDVGTNLEVRGNLLDLNGHRVDVGGDFEARDAGALRMNSAADTLAVVGNAIFRGASSQGQLMAGAIILNGNLSQSGNASAFAPAGTHRTVLVGATPQSVSMTAAGSGIGTSHFAALSLEQTPGGSMYLLSDVWVDGMLVVPPNASAIVSGTGPQRLVSRGADVRQLTFDAAGWVLFDGAPVIAIDTVSWVNSDPAALQFEVQRSGGTIALRNPQFGTTPTSGRYLHLEDSDGAAGGVLTMNVTDPVPTLHNGFATTANGAILNGWISAAGFTWTGGAGSTLWTDPANWDRAAVPAATDSVRIPDGVPFIPVIPGNRTVRTLVSELTSGTLTIQSGPLSITDRLVVPYRPNALSCSAAQFRFAGTGAMHAQGRIDCFVRLMSGTLTLTDSLYVGGGYDLQLDGGAFDVADRHVVVEGNFSALAGSSLRMQQDSAHLVVRNGFAFDGNSTAADLSAGTLEVGGNFFQGGGLFLAGSGHTTVLYDEGAAGGRQLDFSDTTTSSFGNLVVRDGDRTVSSPIRASDVDVTNANLTGPYTLRIQGGLTTSGLPAAVTLPRVEMGGVLAFVGGTMPDTLITTGIATPLPANHNYNSVIVRGVSAQVMSSATDEVTVGARMIVDGGVLIVGLGAIADSARLQVNGPFTTVNGGRLQMTNPLARARINGTATFSGGTTDGILTAGTLIFSGDFLQTGGATDAFAPSGAHESVFSTEGEQRVGFANPGWTAGTSHFNELRIQQAPGSRITTQSTVYVQRQLRESMGDTATIRTETASNDSILVNGLDVTGIRFVRTRVVVRESAAITAMDDMTFDSTDVTVAALEMHRTGGTFGLLNPRFMSVADFGAGGRFVLLTDENQVDGDQFTINVSNPFPGAHSNSIELNGAALNGWPGAALFTWNGSVDGQWANGLNWSTGAVPTATDDVLIPGGTPSTPFVTGFNEVNNLTVNAGANLSLNLNATLNAHGNVVVDGNINNVSINDSTAKLGMEPSTTTTRSATGEINAHLVIQNGTVQLVDSVRLGASEGAGFRMGVTVLSGLLDINGHTLVSEGELRTAGTGRVQMTNPLDSVIVLYNGRFNGDDTQGLLTDGVLLVHGSVIQGAATSARAFAATGNHLTVFTGNAFSSDLSFATPDSLTGSRFARVAFDKQPNLPTVQTMNLFTSPVFVRDVVSMNGPVVIDGGSLIVSGTIVQPPAGVYLQVEAAGSAHFVGVNQGTCDGIQYEFTGVRANVFPQSCLAPGTPTIVWVGGNGPNWGTAANWDLNRVPQAGDSVIINIASTTVSVDVNTTMGWLQVGSGVTVNDVSGATMQFDNDAFFASGSTFNLAGNSIVQGLGLMRVAGTFNWNDGTLRTQGGITRILPSGTATVGAAAVATIGDRQLQVQGTLTLTGSGLQLNGLDPQIYVDPGGTFSITAPVSLLYTAAENVGFFNNGTLEINTAGTARIDWSINNNATLNLVSGTLDHRGRLNNFGTVAVAGGTTLIERGHFEQSAALNVANGGLVQLDNGGTNDGIHNFNGPTTAVNGTLQTLGGATVNILATIDVDSLLIANSTVSIDPPAGDSAFVNYTNHQTGGAFNGSGVFVVRQTFLNGPNTRGTGTIVVPVGATFSLGGDLFGWSVDVSGVLQWLDANRTFDEFPVSSGNFPDVVIRSGGALLISHGATNRDIFGAAGSTITVENGGSIAKVSGTAISNFRQAMTMLTGSIFSVTSGTINVQGTCSMNGTKTGAGSVTGNCGNFP